MHLAAGTSGSEKDSQTATLQGTRNLLELCRRHKPAKLVYISSCSVYGIADYQGQGPVSETAALERFPDRRGTYSASKQEAERQIADFMKSGEVPVVVLRPGTIHGPGGELYTPMMGFSAGSTYVVIGTGDFVLPLTYVDNVAEAIVQSANSPAANGEIFNVVDPEALTKREYNRAIRQVDANAGRLPAVLVALQTHVAAGDRIQLAEASAGADPIPPGVVAEEDSLRQPKDCDHRVEAGRGAQRSDRTAGGVGTFQESIADWQGANRCSSSSINRPEIGRRWLAERRSAHWRDSGRSTRLQSPPLSCRQSSCQAGSCLRCNPDVRANFHGSNLDWGVRIMPIDRGAVEIGIHDRDTRHDAASADRDAIGAAELGAVRRCRRRSRLRSWMVGPRRHGQVDDDVVPEARDPAP